MWKYYERSSPIQVSGGIKSQSKRGEFSQSWWGKRWISALESFQDSARLARGRSYARKGQVLTININVGEITAKVQGSRPSPYKVEIEMDQLSPTAWQQVIDALSKKAIYAARLFSGELPTDIEEIFKEVNIQLLPSHHAHLKTDCSCPDWSNPCKHVAAVLYLLGEEFDRDPFLLFKVRGMDRETFLKQLEKVTVKTKPQTKQVENASGEEKKPVLSSDHTRFWQATKMPDDWLQGGFEKPRQTGSLINSLGKFPFWRGEDDLHQTVITINDAATDHALKILS